jgi:hypothetical protein
MKSKFILALDPSGAYYEGKGTTGWCVYNCDMSCISLAGFIEAKHYDTRLGYWDKHLALLRKFVERYKNQLHIVIEDYRLYASKASNQINSSMETCKLIGILQYFCEANQIPYTMQLASEVKTRWTDAILFHKNLIVHTKRKCTLPDKKTEVNKHARDAIRHAVHYATFKNKE